jgi:hypothetical protein
MRRTTRILSFKVVWLLFAACLLWQIPAPSQETRGSIHGRVLDPSQAAVPGATVIVENADMNTSTRLTTNQTGYYEATLLLPGNYRVSAELTGFKKTVRSGLVLPMSGTLEIDLPLEVGGVAETVSVTAQAPVLETSGVSSGRVLENRSVMDLPVIVNNTMVLVKLAPGLFTGGVNDYLGPHSIAGASDYSTGAGVGGNEWSIDGVPSNGASRQTAYLPHSDAVQEMRVETSNFDASAGHGTLANITMMTKAGTNRYHGALTEQHWQQRWQGTNFFARQAYYRNIAAAEAAGNHALADQLRSQDKQDAGRSNNYAGTIGGPVRIPKLYNGRDRLFFFFSYQGNKDQVVDLPARINTTIPTMAERKGDFSRYLLIDPVRYQIYDPLTVRSDPARPGHYIRDPFPGNVLAQPRIVNPAYSFYTKLLPATNNDNDPKREPLNDYLSGAPLIRDYAAYGSRIDFQKSDKHRFFGRWTYNHWANYASDWTYTTVKGLQSLAQIRKNFGATIDWIYTLGPSTVLDVAVAVNDYQDGNNPAAAMQFKPSDAGLPTYLDQKAGDQHILPVVNLSGYNAISTTYPVTTHYRTSSGKADLTQIRGNHTVRAGFDMRMQYRTGGGGGNTSGNFSFGNTYTRKNDDTFTPAGSLGLSWAAFLMGIPDSMAVATNDSYAMINPYFAWYGQDSWRLSRKLTVNLGLRLEYELGATERYNRMITDLDPNARLPITDAAQAAYARSPIPELDSSKFVVMGGSLYAGSGGRTRQLWQNEVMWLPRVSAAYQITPKTVIRAGYGLFYDTLNVLNQAPDQTGYSRTTSTTITTDSGATWLVGNPKGGIPPMADPFPVRADGTRFDQPTGNALGLMARAGRGWSFTDFDYKHARLQRWRFGIQRQLDGDTTIEVAYVGERAGQIPLSKSLSPLPAQYWATGMVRDTAVTSNMTQNVTNPFRITNFASLQTGDPLQYWNLGTMGFFTGSTIQKNVLLRPFPQMNGLTQNNAPLGKSRTDSLQLTVQRRFAKGFNLNLGYTRMHARAADFFYSEFDSEPTWRESNDARPHRLVAGGIYELPFGKGRAFVKQGILSYVVGGFQVAATYEWEPGSLLNWGNLFYYGKLSDIGKGPHTLDEWFNTDNFERVSSKMPASYQARVFPTRVDGVRADMTNQWNTNIQREFKVKESIALQLRVDALNLQNRTQFGAPNVSPASTDFGRVTSQSNATKRFIQVQARLRF